MGWLRDLMDQSDSGCRSYGDLARAALESSDWPSESRMAERSLASIFSKLDRNQEADWLAERVGVQRVLSKVLGVPLDDVRPPGVRAVGSQRADVRRLRLTSLRYARALDLVDEPLCPGLPPDVLKPGTYSHTFWRAPSGSGRSLVGRFLQARGLSHVIEAATFEDALAQLPERGPVFIELHAQRPRDALPLPAPPRAELCIAADFEPRNPLWRVQASPAVETYLDELVDWVAARLPADGRFDATLTRKWLRGEMRESGILDGLGAALGLCGLADEHGVQTLRGKSAQKLAERYCRDRLLATLDPEAAHSAWLKRNGYDVLVGVGHRLLADSDKGWDEPRSLEHWLELVPLEYQRDADLDWMRLSLSHADSAIRPADIEKAARKFPPGAFRIVRAFSRAELLRDATSQPQPSSGPEVLLSFGPRWLSNALRLDATSALVSGSTSDFGEALLRGHAASRVARELVQRLSQRGSAFIESVLELEGADSAGHIAAVEMTFRAAGVALLKGAEISADSLEALWDEVLSARLEFPDQLPCPRIEYPDPESDALLSRGIWYLAALSISSELGQRAGRRHPLLRPWTAREAHPDLRALCAIIARDLPTSEADRPWVLRAYSLISRLRAEIGALGSLDSPEILERPSVLLDEVMHGVLSWGTVAGIADGALGLPALQALAGERGVRFSAVASAIWEAWDDAQRPALGAAFLATDSEYSSWFWPHIPADLLQALLCDAHTSDIPYETFADEQWHAFLDALDSAPARAGDARAFSLAPDFVLVEALERGLESPALFEALWQRAPDRAERELSRALESRADDDLGRLSGLLAALKPSQFSRLSELFAQKGLANLEREKLGAVRSFLHAQIRDRKPGYLEAYARLSAIERSLSH
ncbi:MAG TPA: hypothetical protein VFK05_38500 [Polyangiaceae bacterium]|nr:hypothetical protein [Polyangiaceae bacterium]